MLLIFDSRRVSFLAIAIIVALFACSSRVQARLLGEVVTPDFIFFDTISGGETHSTGGPDLDADVDFGDFLEIASLHRHQPCGEQEARKKYKCRGCATGNDRLFNDAGRRTRALRSNVFADHTTKDQQDGDFDSSDLIVIFQAQGGDQAEDVTGCGGGGAGGGGDGE